ncbi:hypothetical protein PCO31010_02351 [Pandoraea commovens]|uniref:Uncharacterized protein n=1 Tax=Pandoraea commovens TaxID=2508289 RepID=A0A5E4UZ80_9BURK|nr:hypothetical protein PCO31010_02351 [Pandoraea commovens]
MGRSVREMCVEYAWNEGLVVKRQALKNRQSVLAKHALSALPGA